MQRVVTVKRSIALAVAGLVVGTVGALSVPALASNHTTKAASVPAVTFDFTGTNDEASVAQSVGAAFGGTAKVKDAEGKVVGTAYDLCDKDSIKPGAVEAFCTGLVKFTDGNQVSFTSVLAIPSDPSGYPNEFDGVVNGGTGAYEGITGQAHFVAKSPGVYDVKFG